MPLQIAQSWRIPPHPQHVKLLSVHLVDSKIMIYQALAFDLYCNPSQTVYDAFGELIDFEPELQS